jgi:hypothetical protein
LIKNLDDLERNEQKSDLEILLLQNLYRNEDYAQIFRTDPLRITCPQFKLIMIEIFNIRDVELLDNLFRELCQDCTITSATDWVDNPQVKFVKNAITEPEAVRLAKDTISLEDFFEKMAFGMEGLFEFKISIVLELQCVMKKSKTIPFQKVANIAERFFNRYYKLYMEAKQIAD